MMARGTDRRPKPSQQLRKLMPVRSSTIKYRGEIGAPQFLHRPRSANHVTSGTLRYHGMEYWQCGQCDGGVTMLMPSGIRWMHTFRKLPTMQPNTKKTNDQK